MTKRKSRAALAVVQSVPTIIEFLLDETGSMDMIKAATIGGYNDFLDQQRAQEGLCLLTLTKFDTAGQRTPYSDLDIHMVPNMTAQTFHPGAGTNLRDSILLRMNEVEKRLTQWDIPPRVLFICMTDGDDNASANNASVVREAIAGAAAKGWTMVYLGAHARAANAAKDMGFAEGNVRSFEGAQMRETMTDLATATTAYRATATATEARTDYFASR